MIDNDSFDFNVENDRFCRFAALVALAIAAWHVTLGGQAAATEVDALGAPAPVGFADIVERVKPAVVGVRVKIEEAAQSDEPRQKSPFAPGSPLDLSSTNSAFRFRKNLHPGRAPSWALGSSSPVMVTSLPTITWLPTARASR